MDEDEELRQIGDADAEAAAMAEFDQGYNAPEEAPAEQLPMPQPVDDGGEAAAYEAFDTSYNAPAEQKAPGRVMSIGGGGKGRKPANPFAPQQGPANQAGRDFNRMNSGVPQQQQQMQMPPAIQALQQAAASGSFVARRALIQQFARAADMEQHAAMQTRLQQVQLTQSERMHQAKLQHSNAWIDQEEQSGRITPAQALELRAKTNIGLSVLQARNAEADAISEELKNKALVKQAEQQTALETVRNEMLAGRANSMRQTIKDENGNVIGHMVPDGRGGFTQLKPDQSQAQQKVLDAKVEAEKAKAVQAEKKAEADHEKSLRDQYTKMLTKKKYNKETGETTMEAPDPDEVERRVQQSLQTRQESRQSKEAMTQAKQDPRYAELKKVFPGMNDEDLMRQYEMDKRDAKPLKAGPQVMKIMEAVPDAMKQGYASIVGAHPDKEPLVAEMGKIMAAHPGGAATMKPEARKRYEELKKQLPMG